MRFGQVDHSFDKVFAVIAVQPSRAHDKVAAAELLHIGFAQQLGLAVGRNGGGQGTFIQRHTAVGCTGEYIVGRNMDQAGINLFACQCQVARAKGVDAVSGIAVGFAAIHVGKSSAVDDGIRLGAADIGHSGFAVGNIQLIHINGDHRCFAQALRQRAKGAFFISQLFLQLGSKLSMAAGNQNFHLVPLSLYRINISGGHRQHCAGAGHRGFCHSARRFPTVCRG
jgi:hypothetical protein